MTFLREERGREEERRKIILSLHFVLKHNLSTAVIYPTQISPAVVKKGGMKSVPHMAALHSWNSHI